MEKNELRERCANWYLGLHLEADTTEDINEARALYNYHIKTLEALNKALELDLMLLHMESQLEEAEAGL